MAGTIARKEEHTAGFRPTPVNGNKNDYRLARQSMTLGDHPVSWTIGLGDNFMGFLVPLKSDPDIGGSERVDEVFNLLSQLIDDGYDYVPFGSLSSLKEPVASSLLIGSTEESILLDRFDMAIPLRRASEGYRSYFTWDSQSHDWKLEQFGNIQSLQITGRNILLIAYKKPPCRYKNLDEDSQREVFA